MEILNKVLLYTNKINKPVEDVIKSIKEKRNTDYCGIYELYYHEKLKKLCFEN